MQRSKAEASQSAQAGDAFPPHASKNRAGGPASRGEGPSDGSPATGAGVGRSGDDSQVPIIHGPSLPSPGSPLSHYKGTSLKHIGRDRNGRVIPHKYSSAVARKIATWMLGGYSENDCAVALNIRPGLLREIYGKEIRHGADLMGMDMTSHIVKRAKSSDNMARFVAKARMGWRDGDSKPVDTGILNIFIHN